MASSIKLVSLHSFLKLSVLSKPLNSLYRHAQTMSLFRSFRSNRFLTHLNPKALLPISISNSSGHDLSFDSDKVLSFIHKNITSSAQFKNPDEPQSNHNTNSRRPLHDVFMEAVGLTPKAEGFASDNETENCTSENNYLKIKLSELEKEVRNLKADSEVKKEKLKKEKKETVVMSKGLYAAFTKTDADHKSATFKKDEPVVYKELSKDMEVFVYHLYKHGYFNNANFLRMDKLDFCCFDNSYGRDFIKYAAEMFAKDNQEIIKWLSGHDLKSLAVFGCPSSDKRCAFAAKRLRIYFEIAENTVCSKCSLRHSCKYVNQSIWKGDVKDLRLTEVVKVLISYALELSPPQMLVPDEIKESVSRLLNETLKLSIKEVV